MLNLGKIAAVAAAALARAAERAVAAVGEDHRGEVTCAQKTLKRQKISTVTGLEPAIPRSEVWCLIH